MDNSDIEMDSKDKDKEGSDSSSEEEISIEQDNELITKERKLSQDLIKNNGWQIEWQIYREVDQITQKA